MKKIIFVTLILVAALLAVVVIAPKLISTEKIVAEIKTQVKKSTGRDIAFDGAKLAFFPNVGVELHNVTFSNPSWAKEKNMMTLSRADVQLALSPLFQRRIEMKRFVLDAPVIYLETSADGRNNWDFSAQKTADKEHGEGKKSGETLDSFQIKFGAFDIHKGKFVFANRQKNALINVSDVEMQVKWADFNSPMQLDGKFIYRKKQVALLLELEKPMELLAGKSSHGNLSIKTDDVTAKMDGTLAAKGVMLNGTIDANVNSLTKTAEWLGNGKAQVVPFEKISFTSAALLTEHTLKLKDAALSLDEVQAKGDVLVDFTNKPDITAQLSLNKLNLDRFMGAESIDAKNKKSAKSANAEGWSTTPMDFSGLKLVDAFLSLKTEGFSLKGAEVGASVLDVQLRNGNLRFQSSEAGLFNGKFSSDVRLNAATATPTMAFKFNMKGIDAKPMLTTFADFKKLSGTMDANIAVTSTGNSQKEIIGNLNGNGVTVFRNGALEGINLVDIAQLVQKRLGNMGVGEGKTEFVELGGTFKMNNGIAHNDDLKMKGPLVQASGKGDIDLPRQYIAYRVIPVLTASSAMEGASGLAIPVDIKGPFSNIKIKPDYAGMIKDVVNNPEAMKATIKDVGKQGREVIKTFKKDPASALQGLLGGGGLFNAPAPESPVEGVPIPEETAAPAAPAPEPAPVVTP